MTCIVLDTVHKSQCYHDYIYVILFRSSILCVMVYSLSVGLFLSFSSFVMSSGIFQVCHSCCVLSYVFLFSFLDSSNPKDFHYPIYSSCFVMYESVASDISLNIIVAHSFEINRLYTSTWYGSNRQSIYCFRGPPFIPYLL